MFPLHPIQCFQSFNIFRFETNQEAFKEQAKKDVEESHNFPAEFGDDENENHEIRLII